MVEAMQEEMREEGLLEVSSQNSFFFAFFFFSFFFSSFSLLFFSFMLSCFSLRKFLSAFFKGRARGGQVRLQEARDEAAALREEKAKLKVTSPVACPLCTASLVTSLRSEQSRPCAMCSHVPALFSHVPESS